MRDGSLPAALPVAPSEPCRSPKSDRPCSSRTTASPSRIIVAGPSWRAASAIAGKRCVQSCPPRVMMRTRFGSMCSAILYPSHLISYDHSSPCGGFALRRARHGSTRSGIGSKRSRGCSGSRFRTGRLRSGACSSFNSGFEVGFRGGLVMPALHQTNLKKILR